MQPCSIKNLSVNTINSKLSRRMSFAQVHNDWLETGIPQCGCSSPDYCQITAMVIGSNVMVCIWCGPNPRLLYCNPWCDINNGSCDDDAKHVQGRVFPTLGLPVYSSCPISPVKPLHIDCVLGTTCPVNKMAGDEDCLNDIIMCTWAWSTSMWSGITVLFLISGQCEEFIYGGCGGNKPSSNCLKLAVRHVELMWMKPQKLQDVCPMSIVWVFRSLNACSIVYCTSWTSLYCCNQWELFVACCYMHNNVLALFLYITESHLSHSALQYKRLQCN